MYIFYDFSKSYLNIYDRVKPTDDCISSGYVECEYSHSETHPHFCCLYVQSEILFFYDHSEY